MMETISFWPGEWWIAQGEIPRNFFGNDLRSSSSWVVDNILHNTMSLSVAFRGYSERGSRRGSRLSK